MKTKIFTVKKCVDQCAWQTLASFWKEEDAYEYADKQMKKKKQILIINEEEIK